MAKLVVNSDSLVSVADAIREKGNTTESLEFPNGFVDGINAIESGGGGGTEEIENIIDQSGVLESTDGTVEDKVEQLIDKAEDENAWYQYTGTLTEMPRWAEATCETLPRMNLSKITSLSYRFSRMPNLKRVNFYLNTESATRHDDMFSSCTALEYVKGVNTSKSTNVSSMFSGCTSLKTIVEPLDFSLRNNTNQIFQNCNALEDIRFVPETIKQSIIIPSPVLSNESIKSILQGLAPVETTQTLKVSQIVFNKLLENEFYDYWDEALNKGWDITN